MKSYIIAVSCLSPTCRKLNNIEAKSPLESDSRRALGGHRLLYPAISPLLFAPGRRRSPPGARSR